MRRPGGCPRKRLRRLHWGGMLSNAVQLAAIVASIPYIAVAPT